MGCNKESKSGRIDVTNIIKQFKEIFKVSINRDDYQSFLVKNNQFNLIRVKYTTITFIVLELIMLVFHLIYKTDTLFTFPDVFYGAMYILMIILMIIFNRIFNRWHHEKPLPLGKIRFTGVVFISFILLWCATITLIDLSHRGEEMVYVIALIAIGTVPLFKPLTTLIVYLVIHCYYLGGLFIWIVPSQPSFSNIINPTLFVILAWVISVMRYRSQEKDYLDQKTVERIIEELAIANQKLTRLSQIDGLTGCYNYYMFQEKVKSAWQNCLEKQSPLSLIMIDIDFFKTINDQYGHQAGDACLKSVASALIDNVTCPDGAVARYGGDEFIIILPKIEAKEARGIAEALRKKVEVLDISECQLRKKALKLTISQGVNTIIPDNNQTVEQFIRDTDFALYQAKAERNCYVAISK